MDYALEPAMVPPVEDFEAQRPRLFALAYRMLSSAGDAEDVVQETYLRYSAVPGAEIGSQQALLTTIVTRLCLNRLHSAQRQRETYVGPWLPEPLLTERDPPPTPPDLVLLQESLSMAFLVLLEDLTPVERAVFLLREVFQYEYREIAAIIGKQETTCRQLFSRAKRHIAARRPRFTPNREAHRTLLIQFMRAVSGGELEGLLQLLADDVTMWIDGGGKAPGAATRPLVGREAVARSIAGGRRRYVEPYSAEIRELNGEPAVILRVGTRPAIVIFVEAAHGQITGLRAIANPDKLQRL
jgi:RNA polymerase sigma-70 factor (ECF subfamily)